MMIRIAKFGGFDSVVLFFAWLSLNDFLSFTFSLRLINKKRGVVAMSAVALSGAVPIKYALLNAATSYPYPLFEGRNVVGRSPTAIDDVFFINLESPRSAISRMHAVVIVVPNGDVWIYDAKSTNGTHVSVREGLGIMLEAERIYQLTPGTRILFGDVELTLVVDDSNEETSELRTSVHAAAAAAGVPSHVPRTLSDLPQNIFLARSSSAPRLRSQSQGRSALSAPPRMAPGVVDSMPACPPMSSSADVCAAEAFADSNSFSEIQGTKSSNNAAQKQGISPDARPGGGSTGSNSKGVGGSNKKSVPYLLDSQPELAPGNDKSTPIKKPRPNSNCDDEPPAKSRRKQKNNDAATAQKDVPVTTTSTAASSRWHENLKVCISGFDSQAKEVVEKLIKERKASIVNNVADCTVLLVKHPAPRTPKLLIAMGKGIPIVTSQFFEDTAPVDKASDYFPDLVHNTTKYVAKKLQHVCSLVKSKQERDGNRSGVLQGKSFFISDSVGDAKSVLTDVIKGCDGSISRRKCGDATIITNVDDFYHELLTGALI